MWLCLYVFCVCLFCFFLSFRGIWCCLRVVGSLFFYFYPFLTANNDMKLKWMKNRSINMPLVLLSVSVYLSISLFLSPNYIEHTMRRNIHYWLIKNLILLSLFLFTECCELFVRGIASHLVDLAIRFFVGFSFRANEVSSPKQFFTCLCFFFTSLTCFFVCSYIICMHMFSSKW